MKSTAPIEVFISYAHKDEELCNELIKHIALLKRSGIISAWYDRDISAGTDWKGTIDSHLESAGIVLLLVSSDFVNSDYCYDVEMKRALELHASGKKCVIPIILRPVDWQDAPFGKLQGLPKDCKPVTTWDTQDEAFLDIVRGIKATITKLVPTNSSQIQDSFVTRFEVDFTKLETLLSTGDLVEANEESIRLLKQIFESTKNKDGNLNWNATPCEPLRILDNLWLKTSKGHFGLGVQNRIWRTIPIEEHEPDRWKRVANFGIRLEWLNKDELNRDWGWLDLLKNDKLRWAGTSEVWNKLWNTSNIKELPEGYLPYLPLLSFNCRTQLSIENVPWARWCPDFFNLIRNCKL